MSVSNRILNPTKKVGNCPYINAFLGLKDAPDSPVNIALNLWTSLEQEAREQAKNHGEDAQKILLSYLLEDCIFSSIYATFYEELLGALKQHPQLDLQLINRFQEDADAREQLIGQQAQAHVDYILRQGQCTGCPACEHHADVNELVVVWNKKDLQFFTRLYLGMQTIQLTLEYIIYDYLAAYDDKSRRNLLAQISPTQILNLRQFIFSYVEDMLEE